MGYSRPFDLTDSRPLAPVRPKPAAGKLLGLELLRLASALAVLFFHYGHFAQIAGMAPVERTAIPFYGLLWPFYDYGQYGVQLFWGISGYIFFWKYGAAIHSGAVAAGRFFWLRFSRLYPLHLLTLAAVIGLQAVHCQMTGTDFIYPAGDAGLLVKQLFLATDWGPAPPMSFNGPIWSISAEVAVYGAFFIAMRRYSPSRGLCVAVIVGGLALQLAGFDWVSIACATYFFAGGLSALAPAKSGRMAAIVLAGLALLCAATGTLGDRDKLPMILLVAVPSLLILLARDWPILTRAERAIQFGGNLTYSSYLLHFPLQLLLAIGVASTAILPVLTSPAFLAAYLGVTLGVAAISYRYFELPAQQWLRQHTLKRAAT
jgi:peptidoglycan/LPS O-acetylase OafA/YrhL